jgi:signal transduction histidine kinase
MLHQSRKAQMGEMISVIAHQWRQPLGVISSVTGQVEMNIELDLLEKEQLKKSMHKINTTVEHLSSTMNQFTSFFNPNKKAQWTSFSSIVEHSMNIIGSSLKNKGINIEVKISKEEHIISFEDELIQVLMDMLKNSADFFTQNSIENPSIILEQYINEEFVCLSITDNAGGIKDEVLENLFDPYFSTKKNETGSGLGLHMSKMIVQDHCNGKIEVEQREGGARFIICLPQ